MSIQFSQLAQSVAVDGVVTADEILSLRQLGWGDGQIVREEAEAIFAINRAIASPSPEWVDFFVEALGEFVLNGTEPKGMCDAEEAQWLIGGIDKDGRLETMAELELLVRVLERARNVPEKLKHYALKQVEKAVLTGTGPTRDGGELSDTHISQSECAIVRRVIFSSGGHGPAAVSRHDAEMLFRIKDATLGCENAAEWKELFVDGVANFLTGFFHANAQLNHDRVRELEAFVSDNDANVGRFFGAMVREAPRAANHFGKVFGNKSEGGGFEARMVAGHEVTKTEADWLGTMIESDGEVDELEHALLERIEQEA